MEVHNTFLIRALRACNVCAECRQSPSHDLIACPLKDPLRFRVEECDLSRRIHRNDAVLRLIYDTAQEIRFQLVLSACKSNKRGCTECLMDCLKPRVNRRRTHATRACNAHRDCITNNHIYPCRCPGTQFFFSFLRTVNLDRCHLDWQEIREFGTAVDHVWKTGNPNMPHCPRCLHRADSTQDVRK